MKTILFRAARACTLPALLITLFTGVASAVAGHLVPFRGTAAGSIVNITPTPEGVLFTVHASGHATRLGHFDRVEELLLNPVTGSFTGTILFVAANGDELHVTLVGQFISADDAVGSYSVVGGTGRFVGAVGTAAFEAVKDGNDVSVSFDGSISSHGG